MLDALQSTPIVSRWITTVLFVVLIVGLSVTPGIHSANNVFSWLYAVTPRSLQKVLHVLAYAMLALLWHWTLAGITLLPARLAASFVLTFGIGVGLEWIQTKVPGRFGTVADAVLNTTGAVLGLIIAAALLR